MSVPALSSGEPVLTGDENRFVLFPIRYPSLWHAYKTAQRSYWTTEEVDFSIDRPDWILRLNHDEQHLISTVLAFFASSDGIVAENLVQQFYAEVQIPEARCFYGFQIMMENVHAETYSRFLRELIEDESRLQRLFGAMRTIPTVKAKGEWCLKWFDREKYSFGTRVIAFAVVEGVFFSSSFAAIFWMRSRGLLPGLCHANELIMRDEGQHMLFACMLYASLHESVPCFVVHAMIADAVQLEQEFFSAAMPKGLRGLNARLMRRYVEYAADFLLNKLGYPILYGSKNPFPFMESSAVPGKSNFFERAVSDYAGAAVIVGSHVGPSHRT